MAALTRAPVCAGVRVVAPRKVAARMPVANGGQKLQLLSRRSLQLSAARKPSAVVAAAGDDGYASSDDPEVTSGKRKAVSGMNVKDLQAEVCTAHSAAASRWARPARAYLVAPSERAPAGRIPAALQWASADVNRLALPRFPCPFVPQLAAAGLDTNGSKAELSSRVKTLRSGKPLPAASECACGSARRANPAESAC